MHQSGRIDVLGTTCPVGVPAGGVSPQCAPSRRAGAARREDLRLLRLAFSCPGRPLRLSPLSCSWTLARTQARERALRETARSSEVSNERRGVSPLPVGDTSQLETLRTRSGLLARTPRPPTPADHGRNGRGAWGAD